MTFIDTNIVIYAEGRPHRHKEDAKRAIARLARESPAPTTSTQVLQELAHYYKKSGSLKSIPEAFRLLRELTDGNILPVDFRDMEKVHGIMLRWPRLSASDAAHVAVMENHGIKKILSFDQDFDDVPHIERIGS